MPGGRPKGSGTGKYSVRLCNKYDGCKDCRAYNYERYHHPDNRERYAAISHRANVKLRKNKMEFVREIVGFCCINCGETREQAIQYHHPDGNTRPQPSYRGSGRTGLRDLSWKVLKEDVMTLIPLCGSCHLLQHRKAVVT